MAEYIEREKVCETLNAALNEIDKLNGLFSQDYIRGCRNTLGMVIDDIQKIPAADARPERHGFWRVTFTQPYTVLTLSNGIKRNITGYICSKCGGEYLNPETFCPHCGAMMDGKDMTK